MTLAKYPIYASVAALVFDGAAALADEATSAQKSEGVQEVVVTAQRRAETLQKSSLAIQAVGAGEIAQAGVTQATDLNQLVPGLQIGQGGSQTQIFIRGVGDYSGSPISNPGVAFNVDGVYVGRPQAVSSTFYDVERIEVLKGPQGTLYGRNASGGAINLITRKPTFDGTSGYVTLEGGSYALKHGTGALNVPFGATLAVRGAFDVVDRDGYLTDGTGDDKHAAGRIQALWQPSDSVSILTSVDYAHRHGEGVGYVSQPRPSGSSDFLGSTDPASLGFLAAQVPLGGLMLTGGIGHPNPHLDQTFWNASTEIRFDMDWATLTILPAYRHVQSFEQNYAVQENIQSSSNREITNEVRLNHDGEKTKWVAGLYYYYEDQVSTYDEDFGIPFSGSFAIPINKTHSYAGFGQLSYSVLNDFRVIAGVRYTEDRRKLAGGSTAVNFGFPSAEQYQGSHSFDSVTWKGGLEYDLTPDNMLFFTASTGYKAGGLNAAAGTTVYAPEKLKAYELGLRNRFLNDRLQVNLEVFKWDYDNHQEFVITFDAAGSVNAIIENAGKASIEGFDLDVKARLTQNDTFGFAVEYNNAKYDSFVVDAAAVAVNPGGVQSTGCEVGPSAQGPAQVTLDCSGFQLARAPLWSAQASLEHHFNLPNNADLVASANAQFTSPRWGSVDFTPNTRFPASTTGNFDLTYTPDRGRWSLSAFVRNVGDKRVATTASQNLFQPNMAYLIVNPPRTYGGRITVNF